MFVVSLQQKNRGNNHVYTHTISHCPAEGDALHT